MILLSDTDVSETTLLMEVMDKRCSADSTCLEELYGELYDILDESIEDDENYEEYEEGDPEDYEENESVNEITQYADSEGEDLSDYEDYEKEDSLDHEADGEQDLDHDETGKSKGNLFDLGPWWIEYVRFQITIIWKY